MADEKQVREVARCVRTLIDARGQKVTLKALIPLIENMDLTDPVGIAQQISQDLADRQSAISVTTDQTTTLKVRNTDVVKDWFVANYNFIHQCPEAEKFILSNLTRGRVSKNEQERRRAALVARATAGAETTTEEGVTEDPVTPTTNSAPTVEFDF